MEFVKNMRVGARLGLAFALLLGLLLAMAGTGALLARSINYYADYYGSDIIPSLRAVRNIESAIGDARQLEQLHLLTDDDKEKKSLAARIAEARQAFEQGIKDYEPLVTDDKDREFLKKVSEGAQAYFSVEAKVLRASDDSAADPTQGTAAKEMTFGPAREAFRKVRDDIRAWWAYNEQIAAQATDAAGAAYRRVLATFAASLRAATAARASVAASAATAAVCPS